MHIGHIETFKNLKKYGDIVVIGISTDKRVRERKGPLRPIQNQNIRAELINAVKDVDYVFIYPDKNKKFNIPTLQILHDLRPDVFVTVDKKWSKYRENIESIGNIRFIIESHRINKDSTTGIIQKILKKYKK